VDFFERLLNIGARGYYVPQLAIDHYIPAYRLTKKYYRTWCFRRSIAQAEVDALRPQAVKRFLGVPRYMIGSAIRAAGFLMKSAMRRGVDPGVAFSQQLAICELLGFLAGCLKRRTRLFLRTLTARRNPPGVPEDSLTELSS